MNINSENKDSSGTGARRNQTQMRRRVELLAPAGNPEAFRGAVHAGADAVYLSGPSYGARAFAENFREEEILSALQEAHLLGVRVYLTANVLTRERELPELVSFVLRLRDADLDGVIVQDLGVAAALRKEAPGLALHASTQMSVMGSEAVLFLQRMGFSRVVPARELTLNEIRRLKTAGAEIETFIHGAMCYSCSGRCLMSSFLGGRSGNRGRCAGTCRLPYEIYDEVGRHIELGERSAAGYAGDPGERRRRSDRGFHGRESYPLSMKDLCVLPILPELIDAGIDSFKIEGRMKKPEYAAGVTAIYRRYIDRFYVWDAQGRPGKWEIDPGDLEDLHSLYIRTGLSTGYYHERNGRDMITICNPGYRGASEELLRRIGQDYLKSRRRLQISGKVRILSGKPARLEVWTSEDEGTDMDGSPEGCPSFTAEGDTAEPARSHPLTEDSIREKLCRTGDTPFKFHDLQIISDGHSFLPVSSLNELRRKALHGLKEEILHRYHWENSPTSDSARGASDAAGTLQGEYAGMNCSKRSVAYRRIPAAVSGQPDPKMESGSSGSLSRRSGSSMQWESCSASGFADLPAVMALTQFEAQAQAVLASGADVLILDGTAREHPDGVLKMSAGRKRAPRHLLAALPQILRESDRGWLETYFARYAEVLDGFLVRNLEELEWLHERDYGGFLIADSSLYCWNRSALEVLMPFCDMNVLPLELDQKELWQTLSEERRSAKEEKAGKSEPGRMILQVYGRAPMMVTANCVRRTAGRCIREDRSLPIEKSMQEKELIITKEPEGVASRDGTFAFYWLMDRTGASLPVQIDCAHCQNVIYNSVPTNLLSCMDDPKDRLIRRVGGVLLSFTDETGEETARVLRECRGEAPRTGTASFTYGHYRLGAE